MKKHKHKWRFVYMQYECALPNMCYSTSVMPELWAYLLCRCGMVRRTRTGYEGR